MQQLMVVELMEAMIKMIMGVVVVVTNELGKHTHTHTDEALQNTETNCGKRRGERRKCVSRGLG